MSKATQRPCKYCSKPVGHGDHERYCSENPENLARSCGYVGCPHSGNVIYDYEWVCRHHADLRGAGDTLRSKKNSVSYALDSIRRLEEQINSTRLTIPRLMNEAQDAEKHLDKVVFKNNLNGATTKDV